MMVMAMNSVMTTEMVPFWTGILLFVIGIIGMLGRTNLLSMLMFLELMLNGVSLALVAAGLIHQNLHGTVLTFIIFIITAIEMALTIPVIIILQRQKRSLDVLQYANLKH